MAISKPSEEETPRLALSPAVMEQHCGHHGNVPWTQTTHPLCHVEEKGSLMRDDVPLFFPDALPLPIVAPTVSRAIPASNPMGITPCKRIWLTLFREASRKPKSLHLRSFEAPAQLTSRHWCCFNGRWIVTHVISSNSSPSRSPNMPSLMENLACLGPC